MHAVFSSRPRSCILFGLLTTALAAADPPKTPLLPPATPARLDVVTFDYKTENQPHKVVVTTAPTLLRVDEPNDGYSVIVDPAAQRYLGLEHRNYTWWDFSWPEVRDAVQKSKASSEMLSPGAESIDAGASLAPPTNSTSTSASTDGDDGGYVWHPTEERKRVEGYNCVRWTGDTVSGEPVEAWCWAGPLPKVQAAIEGLRQIDEPMALVPIRTVAPDFIFPVFHALAKGGVTPIQINWGDDQNRSMFRLLAVETRESSPALFAVPKLYIKTTLVTLDGLIDSQPIPGQRKKEPQKTWQN